MAEVFLKKVIFSNKKRKIEIAKALRDKIDNLVENEYGEFCHFKKNLCGLCAISSLALKNGLEKKGFKSKALMGKFLDEKGITDHCWVEDESSIFDITATQFNIPDKVFVIDKKSEEAYWYQDGEVITEFSQFDQWPETQKPKNDICHMLIDSLS